MIRKSGLTPLLTVLGKHSALPTHPAYPSPWRDLSVWGCRERRCCEGTAGMAGAAPGASLTGTSALSSLCPPALEIASPVLEPGTLTGPQVIEANKSLGRGTGKTWLEPRNRVQAPRCRSLLVPQVSLSVHKKETKCKDMALGPGMLPPPLFPLRG